MSRVAVFTDAHGLYEPVEAVIDDIKKEGITDIYSLGDNVGVGPNPSEVLKLLKENNIISLAGNSEEYNTLGIEPFLSYFDREKKQSQEWTASKLTRDDTEYIRTFKHSIDLFMGHKKIALCHFANDVRCDFSYNSTYSYQYQQDDAYKQFLYTNSKLQKKEIDEMIHRYGNAPENGGYISTLNDPLFRGKSVLDYDTIIQGHVHFPIVEKSETTLFLTLKAIGFPCGGCLNKASYLILDDSTGSLEYTIKEVPFNRDKMVDDILESDIPSNKIKIFTNINR